MRLTATLEPLAVTERPPTAPAATGTPRHGWAAVARRALRSGAQVSLVSGAIGVPLGLLPTNTLGMTLVYAECDGLCCWLFVMLGRRLLMPGSLTRLMHSARGIAIVAGACVLGYLAGSSLADWLVGTPGRVYRNLVEHPRGWMPDAMFASLSAGLVVTWFYIRARNAEQRAELSAVEQQATLARLVLLQSQLEPHMLFNTLANLRALIDVDPARAQAMLDRLIDFLRATLAGSRRPTHPLKDEFARLDDYLALMQVRMGDRLRVTSTLPQALAGAPVPPLLLQPLVENAIKHGLEPQRGPGELAISAHAEGSTLVLRVADGGRGLEAAANARDEDRVGSGFGLAQVRERLQTLHGAAATFTLAPRPGGGTLAEIRLPLGSPE
jgi:signal transduction histidine kinase